MKKLLLVLLASLALLSPAIAGRNEDFTGTTTIQSGAFNVKRGVKVSIDTNTVVTGLVRKFYLGQPIVSTTNYLVVSTNMKNGSYTLAHQPDVPRIVTVTATTVASGADTPGVVTVTGTDYAGNAITDVITPAQGSTVAGVKAFKTITSIVGSGWVIAGGNDTIVIGVGNLLGLPISLDPFNVDILTTVGTTVGCYPATTGSVALSTVDASGATYDSSKKVVVFLDK